MTDLEKNETLLKEALSCIETLFEESGAVPAEEINKARRESLGLRPSYVFRETYYRAEGVQIDGQAVIILYETNDPAYARVGTEDSIAAFLASLPRNKLEKEVRFALGIEPYPDTYPVYEG